MRGFDVTATTIRSWARMSQSDSQYVIFITVGQEKGIMEHLAALSSTSTLNMTRILARRNLEIL